MQEQEQWTAGTKMIIDSPLFEQLRNLSATLINEFDDSMTRVENPKHTADLEGWQDYFWESSTIRKAHLKTIEPVGKNKLWLMHINIFPNEHVDLPIFGLDIVANPKKISGCFCDYSPTDVLHDSNHPYMVKFKTATEKFTWTKERVMPDWALEIFSENIIGAGSIRTGEETEQLVNMALELSRFYTMEMSNPQYNNKRWINTLERQNKYCEKQKLNRMLHSSILAMGISEERKNQYVENVLFEEV